MRRMRRKFGITLIRARLRGADNSETASQVSHVSQPSHRLVASGPWGRRLGLSTLGCPGSPVP
jgi:hypothetical protein